LTTEPDPGSGLARRQSALPDAAVPQRAGAIVREFIGSIVEEAEARMAQIREEAAAEADVERRAAHAGAHVIRVRIDAILGELTSLRTDLARESDKLTAQPTVARVYREGRRALPAGEPASEGAVASKEVEYAEMGRGKWRSRLGFDRPEPEPEATRSPEPATTAGQRAASEDAPGEAEAAEAEAARQAAAEAEAARQAEAEAGMARQAEAEAEAARLAEAEAEAARQAEAEAARQAEAEAEATRQAEAEAARQAEAEAEAARQAEAEAARQAEAEAEAARQAEAEAEAARQAEAEAEAARQAEAEVEAARQAEAEAEAARQAEAEAGEADIAEAKPAEKGRGKWRSRLGLDSFPPEAAEGDGEPGAAAETADTQVEETATGATGATAETEAETETEADRIDRAEPEAARDGAGTTTTEKEARPEPPEDGGPDDRELSKRLARMTDAELASAYRQAMAARSSPASSDRSSNRPGGARSPKESYWGRLAGAAVAEAAKRPAFTGEVVAKRRRGLIPGRRKTRDTDFAELCAAVRVRGL